MPICRIYTRDIENAENIGNSPVFVGDLDFVELIPQSIHKVDG